MKQKLVFVASLSHSGSTLINLLLGAHPKLVGLGEIDTVLQMSPAQLESERVMRCSCGVKVRDCAFWKPAMGALLAWPLADLRERYAILFETFQQLYGADATIVDSSKYIGQLRTVAALPDVDMKVIHLLKDVRGFTVSQRDATAAEIKYNHLPSFGNPAASRWLYLHTIKSAGYLFWKWYLRNMAVKRILRDPAIEHTRVGYDELAQAPAETMRRLYDFLKLEVPADLSAIPKRTNSHAFMGNPMLGDPGKMGEVRYDDRWKTRTDWVLAARFFPQIMRFNEQEVYSSGTIRNATAS
jgi:hypothetical protein